MGATKKFKIVIEQVKRDYHEMYLEGENLMSALDSVREMVNKRNKKSSLTGNVFSVIEIEEIKDV